MTLEECKRLLRQSRDNAKHTMVLYATDDTQGDVRGAIESSYWGGKMDACDMAIRLLGEVESDADD